MRAIGIKRASGQWPGALFFSLFFSLFPFFPLGKFPGDPPCPSTKKALDERLAVEGLEIVDALAYSDVLHRDFQLVGNADHHPAFGGAVQFGNGQSRDVGHGGKLPRLLESILTGGSVQHQQHFVGSIGDNLLHHAFDLGQFGHQIDLVVQTAGRIDDHDVGSLRLGRGNGVESDRGGVGAHLLAHHGHARAFGPYGQLVDGGGAERIGRTENDFVAPAGVLRGQFANGRGFAYAVDTDDHHDVRCAVGTFEGEIDLVARAVLGEQGADFLAQDPVQFVRAEVFVAGNAGFDPVDDLERGVDAYIGGDECHFQLVEHFLVDGVAGGDEAADLVEKRALGFFQSFVKGFPRLGLRRGLCRAGGFLVRRKQFAENTHCVLRVSFCTG